MLVNWKIEYCDEKPANKQPPDYFVKGKQYWFYRYFKEQPEVDVIDTKSFSWIEHFEKRKLHFYILQGLKAIPKLNKYDLIVSHGMPSAVIVALWRKFFKTKSKHIVFDIGCFNSASESGVTFKLMQFISKSIDRIIYHTSCQEQYYRKFFPWIKGKTDFLCFGADYSYINSIEPNIRKDRNSYILCVGGGWRDRDTLVKAYRNLDTNIPLRFVGQIVNEYKGIKGIEQVDKVSFTTLLDYIDNALFCVLPLVWKNYSYGQMTLLDQMSMGKCVVAARVPSLVDYAEDGKTVMFYEPQNIDDCTRVMKMALNNKKLRNQIGIAAKNSVENKCNEEIMAKKIEKIMKNCYEGVIINE